MFGFFSMGKGKRKITVAHSRKKEHAKQTNPRGKKKGGKKRRRTMKEFAPRNPIIFR